MPSFPESLKSFFSLNKSGKVQVFGFELLDWTSSASERGTLWWANFINGWRQRGKIWLFYLFLVDWCWSLLNRKKLFVHRCNWRWSFVNWFSMEAQESTIYYIMCHFPAHLRRPDKKIFGCCWNRTRILYHSKWPLFPFHDGYPASSWEVRSLSSLQCLCWSGPKFLIPSIRVVVGTWHKHHVLTCSTTLLGLSIECFRNFNLYSWGLEPGDRTQTFLELHYSVLHWVKCL